MPSHLSAAEQKQVQMVIDRARGDRTVPHSAQESIPFQRMFPDGICRVTDNYYTKTIQFKALLDENTKLWYSSTLSLYEALEKEKTEQKKVQKDKDVYKRQH